MAVEDQSFCGTPNFQSFGGTKFESRGCGVTLVFSGFYRFLTDPTENNIQNVGQIDGTVPKKIGLNEGFDSLQPKKIIEYKGRLYTFGDFNKKADDSGDFGGMAVLDPKSGIWGPVGPNGIDFPFFDGPKNYTIHNNELILSTHPQVFPPSLPGLDGTSLNVRGLFGWNGSTYRRINGGNYRVFGVVASFLGTLYTARQNSVAEDLYKWLGTTDPSTTDEDDWDLIPYPDFLETGPLRYMTVNKDKTLLYLGNRSVITFDGDSFSLHTDTVRNATDDADRFIHDLIFYKGEIVICGDFELVDGVSAKGVARFREDPDSGDFAWEQLGQGITIDAGELFTNMLVTAAGQLAIGGKFDVDGDGDPLVSIGVFDEVTDKIEPISVNQDDLNLSGSFIDDMTETSVKLTGGQ